MRVFRAWVVALAAFMGAPAAQAATITVTPSANTVSVGDAFSVDLAISGLGDGSAPSVGTFDLDLGFDPAILGFDSVTFGNQLDLFGLGDIQSFDDSVAGTINVFELSFDLAADLNDFQAESFILATLTFTALSAGISDLLLTILALGDADGAPLLADITNASVEVTDSSAVVPLPGAWLLLLSGLSMAVAARRC